MIGLTALDLTCPLCFTPSGEYCFARSPRFHQERINMAAAITREANKKERERATKG